LEEGIESIGIDQEIPMDEEIGIEDTLVGNDPLVREEHLVRKVSLDDVDNLVNEKANLLITYTCNICGRVFIRCLHATDHFRLCHMPQ
jgi:hypothetical protein